MVAPTNSVALRVGNASLPKEGPRALPYQLDFSVNPTYKIAVSDLLSKGPGFAGISAIQGFWIDNSQANVPFIAQLTGTGQIIRAPAGTQGYYPVLSPSIGDIILSSGAGIVINFDIYNVPLPASTWGAGAVMQFVNGGTANGALKTSDVLLDNLADPVKGLLVYTNPAQMGPRNAVPLGSVRTQTTGASAIFNVGASGTVVTSVLVSMTGNCANGVGEENHLFIDAGPDDWIYVPSAVPATIASGNIKVIDRSYPNGLLMPNAGSVRLNWAGTTLTSGHFFAEIWGYQLP